MHQNGPWQITGSEEKYKNPWIRVREDQVIHPDGTPGIFGIVEYQPGLSVLPIDDEGNVYFLKKFCYALQGISIECASGGIDEGEDPLTAAKRELKEELGIEGAEWQELGLTHPFTMIFHSPTYLFITKNLTFGEKEGEMGMIDMLKIPLETAVEMAMNGEIVHTPSALLILKAAFLQKTYSCSV